MRCRAVMTGGVLSLCILAACQTLGSKPGFGIVVRSELAPGASPKQAVLGVSDTGRHLFGHALLQDKGGANSSFAGAALPQWIRITWREGDVVRDYATASWKGGTVVGDYRVEVASRVPTEVQRYAAAGPDRALRLIFRIKDDGVLLAWDVQDISANRQGWVFSRRGGDF